MICSKRQLYTLYICAKLLKPTDNFIRKHISVTFLRVNENFLIERNSIIARIKNCSSILPLIILIYIYIYI